jgi:putative mRNA 3-end processing factor
MPHPETWLKVLPQGLFCEPGGFFIDPLRAVDRAVVTHAHSDHARPGHRAVLASADTLALMRARLGEDLAGETQQALGWGEPVTVGDVRVWLQPAGHVLGSAQVAMDYHGARAVVSGDYKRTPDPTCAGFEPIGCDVFVTEATFALPVFVHPRPEHEIAKLLDSVALFPERTHVVGCYALGKCQRLIALLRQAGWDRPIWLHGALAAMCAVYEARGVALGELRPATSASKGELAGTIVLAPPGAVADRWARRLADPVVAMASGWMRVRQRAKSRGVELPLVISDHADWNELNATLDEVGAPEVWVTHGREEALIHAAGQRGIRGRALRLVGYDEDDEEETSGEPEAATGPVPLLGQEPGAPVAASVPPDADKSSTV